MGGTTNHHGWLLLLVLCYVCCYLFCYLLTGSPKALFVARAVGTQLLQTACVDLVLQSVVTKPAVEDGERGSVGREREEGREREKKGGASRVCQGLLLVDSLGEEHGTHADLLPTLQRRGQETEECLLHRHLHHHSVARPRDQGVVLVGLCQRQLWGQRSLSDAPLPPPPRLTLNLRLLMSLTATMKSSSMPSSSP